MSRTESIARRGSLAALLSAALLALGGGGLAACGDNDKEGAGEEAGKALDDATREGGQELKETGKDAERELDDDDDGKDK